MNIPFFQDLEEFKNFLLNEYLLSDECPFVMFKAEEFVIESIWERYNRHHPEQKELICSSPESFASFILGSYPTKQEFNKDKQQELSLPT